MRGADGQLKNTEQLFMESAAALSRMENNTKKAALATVIFGRAVTQLLPMLKDGSDGLMAVMEAYPDLKANQTMNNLTEELTSTENKGAFSRQAFNDAVTAYNISQQSFPAVVFAGMFGPSPDGPPPDPSAAVPLVWRN